MRRARDRGKRPGRAWNAPGHLPKMLTVYVRSERSGDWTLENAFKSGVLTAIVRRAAVLANGADA